MKTEANFPRSACVTGSIHTIKENDEASWALFDFEGFAVFKARNLGQCYFFAFEHELVVLSRH